VGLIFILNCSFIIYHDVLSSRHVDNNAGGGSIGGSILVLSFLYGISFYFLRNTIIWSKTIFFITIPLLFFLLSLPVAFWGDALTPLPAAYMTTYLGLLEPRRLRIVSSGDYSYGLYLYGFPIQQSIVASFGDSEQSWYVNFGISFSIASIIAVGSWHLVEKHAAKFRPILFKLETMLARIIAPNLPRMYRNKLGD
jgi:peptidoglycan/LPS O-acetylase OafA/YrhL